MAALKHLKHLTRHVGSVRGELAPVDSFPHPGHVLACNRIFYTPNARRRDRTERRQLLAEGQKVKFAIDLVDDTFKC